MKSTLGVVTVSCLVLLAGCGGTPELDSGEVETVTAAQSAVTSARQSGALKAGDAQKLEALMILCREKPLAESDGMSMRELVDDLAPKLSKVDPEWSAKLERLATNGCD